MARLTIDKRVTDEKTFVKIAGVVDEDADFGMLEGVQGRVDIDVRGVRRFNSIGIRFWVDAMRGLGKRAVVTFVECPPQVVEQLNMIRGFLGHATVSTFYGPMRCPRCDHGFEQRFTVHECRQLDGLPTVACPKCGRDAELDDLEDNYLLFIREPTIVR